MSTRARSRRWLLPLAIILADPAVALAEPALTVQSSPDASTFQARIELSPDRRSIAFRSYAGVFVWDLSQDEEPRLAARPLATWADDLVFSPTARTLGYASGQSVWFKALAAGGSEGDAGSLVASLDGKSFTANTATVGAVALVDDGHAVLAGIGNRLTLVVWSVDIRSKAVTIVADIGLGAQHRHDADTAGSDEPADAVGGPDHARAADPVGDAVTDAISALSKRDKLSWATKVALDTRGRRLAVASGTDLMLWDLAAGTHRHLTRRAARELRLSADGKRLATLHEDGRVSVLDVDSGRQLAVFPTGMPLTIQRIGTFKEAGVVQFSLSADGAAVAVSGSTPKPKPKPTMMRVGDQLIALPPMTLFEGLPRDEYDEKTCVWNASSGKRLRCFDGCDVGTVDGDLVACMASSSVWSRKPLITLRRLGTGSIVRALRPPPAEIDGLSVSADGKQLVVQRSGASEVWDLRGVPSVVTVDETVIAAKPLPSGDLLVKHYVGGELRLAWRRRTTGAMRWQRMVMVTGMGDLLREAVWNERADRTGLAFEDRIEVRTLTSWKLLRTIRGYDGGAISFSDDGLRLRAPLARGGAKALVEVDLATGDVTAERQVPKPTADDDHESAHAWSGDGTRVATSSGRTFTVVSTGTRSATCEGRTAGAIAAMSFAGADRLWTATKGGVITAWSASDCTELASIHYVDLDEYVIVTPDGHYLSSPLGVRRLQLVDGTQTASFEQFDLERNRPDLVLARLGLAPPALVDVLAAVVEKRRATAAPTPAAPTSPPRVELTSTPLATTTTATMRVPTSLEAVEGALAAVDVRINGVPVAVTATPPLAGEARWTGELAFELTAGANRISIVATTDRQARSLPLTTLVTYDRGNVPRALRPRRFVVALGVSTYADAHSLGRPAADARAIAKLLGESRDRTLVLTDGAVTAQAIRDRIPPFLAAARVDDEIVFFLAGHGVLDDALRYRFAPYDMDFANPSARGLSYAELEQLVAASPARKRLLLIDTCNAGDPEDTGVPADGIDRLAIAKQLFVDLHESSGAIVLAAARGDASAFDGYFTAALVRGLGGRRADLNRDGVVLASELARYVTRDVERTTDGFQRPILRFQNPLGDWRIR